MKFDWPQFLRQASSPLRRARRCLFLPRRNRGAHCHFLRTETLEQRVLLAAAVGEVQSFTKISEIQGNFTGILDDNDLFGGGMAAIGDLDGDGVQDLAVGAREDDDGGTDRGAVYILFLNNDGTVKSHQKISNTEGDFLGDLDDDDEFGLRVASLGDLDGDGLADLAVGARSDDDGGTNRGAVYILFLNNDGTVKSHQKISDIRGGLTGLDDFDQFGVSITALGDLDGDGVTDLAVGAELDDDGGPSRGAVYILFLNTDGTVKNQQKISDTAGNFTALLEDSGNFGIGMANIGDLDGDLVTDLAVGAYHEDGGGSWRGAVYVLFLNSDGTVKSHQKISETEGNFSAVLEDQAAFGVDAANVGDLDGDGVTDLAVGGFGHGSLTGSVYVLFLNSDGTVKSHQTISEGQGGLIGVLNAQDHFGVGLVGLGDLGGDGTFELAVGAYRDDDGGENRGAVYILSLEAGIPPPPVDAAIIDDGDDGFSTSGAWTASPNALFPTPEGRDGDIRHAAAGDGSKTATWTFAGLEPGNYRISATWSTHMNRATNAPYTIFDGTGGPVLETALVNQELAPDDFSDDGSDWEDLGVVTITGSELVVQLSNAADQYVIADGIRIVESPTPPPPPVRIIDDGDAGFSTTEGWNKSPIGEGRLNDVRTNGSGDGSEAATWTFSGLAAGNYVVAATWSPHANRATNAPFTIRDSAGGTILEAVVINQEIAPDDFNDRGSDWEHLAVVAITGDTLVVELSDNANQYVIADAIRIEPTEQQPLPPGIIIDNADYGFTTAGTWNLSPIVEGHNGTVRTSQKGGGSNIATWTFSGLTPGQYRVSATWSAHANRATNAPFEILDSSQGPSLGTVLVNQEQTPDDFTTFGSAWEDLMTVTITGSELVVTLNNLANDWVIADAIRIQPIISP